MSWTDEAGVEQNPYCTVQSKQLAPYDYATASTNSIGAPPTTSFPVEAIAGTPITYKVEGFEHYAGTYELFITVERLQ
jgi:hypothetical protein